MSSLYIQIQNQLPTWLKILPAEQSVQSNTEPAPSISPYFPASHARHTETDQAPTCEEYVPLSQRTHTDADIARRDDEYFPAPQLVHPWLPASTLYLPSAHPTHVPLTLVYPALHWQDACPEALSA